MAECERSETAPVAASAAAAGDRWGVLLGAAAPLAVLALYLRTLGFEFVWDDRFLSLLPVYVSGDLRAVLTGPGNGLEYLPVRDLSLMLDHRLAGPEPALFHATNVGLFALAVYLVYLVYRSWGAAAAQPGWVAGAAALLFAVHPLQVEPVAFVTGRNALLALLFSVAALWLHDRSLRGQRRAWLASLACTALALFSKATAVALPLLLVLQERVRRPERGLPGAVAAVTPHLALGALALAVHLWMAGSTGVLESSGDPLALAARLPFAFFVPFFYAWKFVWPYPLSIHYGLGGFDAQPVLAVAGVIVVWAALVFALRRSGQRPWLGFLAAGFLVALLPVANLIPTSPAVADRYAQLALVFLAPIPVALVARLPRRAAWAVGLLVVLPLAVLTHRQVGVWRNDFQLFEHAISVDSTSTAPLSNLAIRLFDAGETDEALELARRLHDLVPDDPTPERLQGRAAERRGDLVRAELLLRDAARKEVAARGPGGFRAQLDLADLLARQRRGAEAIRAYEEALARIGSQPRYQRDRLHAEQQLQALSLRPRSTR